MDDERWEPGMPVLDRQAVVDRPPAPAVRPASGPSPAVRPSGLPPSLAALPPRSVPETKPTPLQAAYVYLSVVVLVCGFVAITALELGAPLGAPLVKLCVIVGAPILIVTTLDAALRIWRSAWAWMPVDRGKGLFRLSWLVVATVGIVAVVVASVAVVLG
jgi:hypothetical protein